MKTVTIAIPALHRPDLTGRCIQTIQRQTLSSTEWEIVVIENEARPQSILPDPLPPNTRRIELPQNEGTTRSINRAVDETSSKYVLLLNNDIELEPGYLQTLVQTLDADPKLGFAAGKLLRATQRTHLDGAGDAMLIAGGSYRLGSMDADSGQFDAPMPIIAGCGAAVLYRRDVFVDCGALDADFFAYLDDIDLGLRSQWLGFGGQYVPQAVAYHVGSATLGDVVHPRIVQYITRNQVFLLAKDYGPGLVAKFLPRILLFQAFWLAFALRNRAPGAYFRGLVEAVKGIPAMREKRKRLLSQARITEKQFAELLRASERQVYQWHVSRPAAMRSTLLNAYFRIFRAPH